MLGTGEGFRSQAPGGLNPGTRRVLPVHRVNANGKSMAIDTQWAHHYLLVLIKGKGKCYINYSNVSCTGRVKVPQTFWTIGGDFSTPGILP